MRAPWLHRVAVAVTIAAAAVAVVYAAEPPEAAPPAMPPLTPPQLVNPGLVQQQLYLHSETNDRIPARMTGTEMAWQKLVGPQPKGQPPRYLRLWVRPDATGGIQILGRRSIDFQDLGLELHWPTITYAPTQYNGRAIQAPKRAEGKRESWDIVAQPSRADTYSIGCDLGQQGKFLKRHVTWTADFREWRFDPATNLGVFTKPADHRYVVLWAVVDVTTDSTVNSAGEPVEFTPTFKLGPETQPDTFSLYRVDAFWQQPFQQFSHVPAYAGTSYWGPAAADERQPHLFAWLFPNVRYQIILTYILGAEDGVHPMMTSDLLKTQLIDYQSSVNAISYLEPGGFGHSQPPMEGAGPVWQCGLNPNLARIDPDGKMAPLDAFVPSMKLWVDTVEQPEDRTPPQTLDEAVSWDEEMMWSGGARTAYVGIITGEIPPDQVLWYQRWVQRVHELGYKAAVGWNCAEVFPTDYTYLHRPALVAKTADGNDVPSPGLGYKGVMLDWLSTDWQDFAHQTAKQLLDKVGFDYIYLDWAPMDEVHYHYLLTPVDGTMADCRRKVSLSTGVPGQFSWFGREYPRRFFIFGDTEAKSFATYTGAPVGHGYFSWNRPMTEAAGWMGDPATKAAAFERWCQMAAMRMAYVGVPSLWQDPGVTGASCYLGPTGMKILDKYSQIVGRVAKESWGVCTDLPVTTDNDVKAFARLFLPSAWSRGRFYLFVGADEDTVATVELPLLTGRYMVCDTASSEIWSGVGPITVPVDHTRNILYPAGGLRTLLIQQLR